MVRAGPAFSTHLPALLLPFPNHTYFGGAILVIIFSIWNEEPTFTRLKRERGFYGGNVKSGRSGRRRSGRAAEVLPGT